MVKMKRISAYNLLVSLKVSLSKKENTFNRWSCWGEWNLFLKKDLLKTVAEAPHKNQFVFIAFPKRVSKKKSERNDFPFVWITVEAITWQKGLSKNWHLLWIITDEANSEFWTSDISIICSDTFLNVPPSLGKILLRYPMVISFLFSLFPTQNR